MITIKEIGEISSGLVVSRKKAIQESEIAKTYKQLNLRSINNNGYIDHEELELFSAKEIIDKSYLTQSGDIIVRLTDPFTAVYIDQSDENIVISSNFCVIRNIKKYNKLFLSYYLNSDNAKKMLFSNTQGSIMKNINMCSIADLELPNISLSKQLILGKLVDAQTKKNIILNKEQKLGSILSKIILDKTIKEETHNE